MAPALDVRTDPTAVAVALSCLRLGPDARAPRFLKEMLEGRAPDEERWLFQIADRLEAAPDARAALVAKARSRAKIALDRAARGRLEILPYFAPEYPAALHNIADPPIVL